MYHYIIISQNIIAINSKRTQSFEQIALINRRDLKMQKGTI